MPSLLYGEVAVRCRSRCSSWTQLASIPRMVLRVRAKVLEVSGPIDTSSAVGGGVRGDEFHRDALYLHIHSRRPPVRVSFAVAVIRSRLHLEILSRVDRLTNSG